MQLIILFLLLLLFHFSKQAKYFCFRCIQKMHAGLSVLLKESYPNLITHTTLAQLTSQNCIFYVAQLIKALKKKRKDILVVHPSPKKIELIV